MPSRGRDDSWEPLTPTSLGVATGEPRPPECRPARPLELLAMKGRWLSSVPEELLLEVGLGFRDFNWNSHRRLVASAGPASPGSLSGRWTPRPHPQSAESEVSLRGAQDLHFSSTSGRFLGRFAAEDRWAVGVMRAGSQMDRLAR